MEPKLHRASGSKTPSHHLSNSNETKDKSATPLPTPTYPGTSVTSQPIWEPVPQCHVIPEVPEASGEED